MKTRLFTLFVLLVNVALLVSGVVSPTVAQVQSAVEVLYLDMHIGQAGPVIGNVPLENNVPYVVQVSGTWSAWYPRFWSSYCGKPEDWPIIPSPGVQNGKVGVDAAYVFAAPIGKVWCERPDNPPWRLRNFQISLDGGATWLEADPIDNGYHANHLYEYLIVGQGFPAQFRLLDSTYDDYGVLTIIIEPGPTPTPVILLPGMTASAKWRCFLFEVGCDVQEGWHWMPSAGAPIAQRYYQPLVSQLNAAGYTEENHYLQVFFYDWRRPIAENVAKLKAKIDEVKAATGATKVDLVGHSMGGLVGRAYIQSIAYENDVANIITLGSPHEGAAKTYPYWEGAFLYQMLPYESIAYPILIHYYTRRLGPIPVYAIRSKIPSIQDLLPTVDYLYDEVRGDQVKPEVTMVQRNTYLPGLNADAGTLFARTEVNTFVGQSINTPVRFFVHDYFGQPYWEDGEPNWDREPEFLSSQGDGTVSATSAKLPSPAQVQEFPGVDHGALPGNKDVVDAIFAVLGIPIPPSAQVRMLGQTSQEILVLALDGPADGTITDPLGQSVGPGGVTIPGAEYISDPDDPFKLIMIPSPEEGGFKINLVGSGSGSYELGLLDTFSPPTIVITDVTALWDAPSSQIEPGVTVSFALTYTLLISPTTRLIAETPVIEIPVWAGEIEVEGRALPGNTVEVRDADTEVLLGSGVAGTSGHFNVSLSVALVVDQRIYPKANGVVGVPVTVQKRPFTIYLPLVLKAR